MISRDDKLSVKLDHTNGLNDVFKSFKNSLNKTFHTSTVALFKGVVKEYDSEIGYGIINIAPIPLEDNIESYMISAYILDDISFNNNELILVIFTDLDFIGNIDTNRYNQIKNGNPKYHSTMNGVAIKTSSITTSDILKNIDGYDESETQVLKNIAGTLTWVNEA